MKKIPTLFQRIYENHKVVGIEPIPTPGCEKTRVVNIQLTYIDDEEKFNTTPEEAKEIYTNMLDKNTEQILVDVKDFVWDEEGAEE